MRCVVITGVAHGLGRALAERALADENTRVLGLGRSGWEHERLTLRRCDLSRLDDLPSAAELRRLLQGSDEVLLIHNAAVIGPVGPIGELEPRQLIDAVTVNFTAPIVLTNTLIQALGGYPRKVFFISSGAAHHVIDGWSVYSATKRGCEEFFAHLAEKAEVEIVNPGVMDTGMQAAIREARFAERDRFQQRYERGELADPHDVAARIL